MTKPIKITRTLFVGLGGTGVRAILRAKQCFVDAYGEVPPMVTFLAIDTDKAIKDWSVQSRKGKHVQLTENEICFCSINGSALEIYHTNPGKFQWIPKKNVDFLSNLKNEGAGQVRSNGRFLARYNASLITSRINSCVSKIAEPLPLDCKFTYDLNDQGEEHPTKVLIVGSVAGGTGSGTFMDVLVLIAKALRDSGRNFSIRPWLVLPDVFRNMAPGPASSSVYQNAYGAIRELDYLYHLPKSNTTPIDFGFDVVNFLPEGIRNAYIINSTNNSGITFQNINDIADTIGRCMFLPSNESNSVEDNLDNLSFEFNIKDKKAHYISAGSAEIVYDNQAVGKVIAHGIISQICNELVQTNSFDALKEVNTWMANPAVAIQEHDADLLTDSILAKSAPFAIIIDRDSDINTINANVNGGADADYVLEEVRDNEKKKLNNVKEQLVLKINELLNTPNGVGKVKNFLESLIDNVAICKNEMQNEAEELKRGLSYPVDWESDLKNLRGPFGIFYKDAAYSLSERIALYISQKRDLLRHNWAIQFYADFEVFVGQYLQNIQVFKSNLETVERKQRREISLIQQISKSHSHFQVYLHNADVENYNLPDEAEVSSLFRNRCPISQLVNRSGDELYDIFFNFAKSHSYVIDAVNVSIEEKMSKMSQDELTAIFNKVKAMSSPLWSLNTGGHKDVAMPYTKMFIIGVQDRDKGIIKDSFHDMFVSGDQKPTFATTHQTDRITFFQGIWASPAYAINNMRGYFNEAEERNRKPHYPAYYIDEVWHQRMLVEGFDLSPAMPIDEVLPNWVSAIVHGFITYDTELNSYCIESEKGDILSGGLLELGPRRDLAFEQFRVLEIYKEVKERCDRMIIEKGRPAVEEVIKNVKNQLKTYVVNTAQLSSVELDRIQAKDPAYQMVRDLLEKEVAYLKEIEF